MYTFQTKSRKIVKNVNTYNATYHQLVMHVSMNQLRRIVSLFVSVGVNDEDFGITVHDGKLAIYSSSHDAVRTASFLYGIIVGSKILRKVGN